MRGSPLLRSLLITIALLVAGFGMMKLTRAGQSPEPAPTISTTPVSDSMATPYRLMLSADAAEITLKPGNLKATSGTINLDPANPHVILSVRWKVQPATGHHHFAKLTLEPPGQPTLVQVFDATGDIDELFELPLKKFAE